MIWFAVGAVVVFALLGVLSVALGAYAFLQRCWLMAFGEHAIGTVVGLVADEKSPTPDEPVTEFDFLPAMPHLRIAFTDHFGESHEVTSDISVSPKTFRPGDNVPVLYRSGHPETFVVNRFWMKWGLPILFIGGGLVLLGGPVAFLGTVWPAFGAWAGRIGRQLAPVAVPLLAMGLPTLFALLGAQMIYRRLRRLREDFRTQGTIMATGSIVTGIGADADTSQWIRVSYRDANSHEQSRIVSVCSGLLSRTRREEQAVDLLVDRQAPQDVLLNEPLELWFVPLMFLGLGSIVALVFTWAWLSGKLTV